MVNLEPVTVNVRIHVLCNVPLYPFLASWLTHVTRHWIISKKNFLSWKSCTDLNTLSKFSWLRTWTQYLASQNVVHQLRTWWAHTHMHTYMYKCVHTREHAFTIVYYRNIQTHTPACVHTHKMHTYVNVHMYVGTYTYMCTHARACW